MAPKTRVCFALLPVIGTLAFPASSQFICGGGPEPGMRQVGVRGGGNGVAPAPLCVYEDEVAPSGPAPDPMEAFQATINARKDAIDEARRQQQELLSNPESQRMQAGYWELPEPDAATRPGSGCSATFKSMAGMLGVIAPAQPGKPVMTLFTGMDSPRPSQPTQVEVVFHQSGGETMPMPAMNFATGVDACGTIAIGVRDLPSLLSGFKDSEEVALDLNGKRIYALTYHDGDAMKSHMQRCGVAGKR